MQALDQLTLFNKMYLVIQFIYLIVGLCSIWYLIYIIIELRNISSNQKQIIRLLKEEK